MFIDIHTHQESASFKTNENDFKDESIIVFSPYLDNLKSFQFVHKYNSLGLHPWKVTKNWKTFFYDLERISHSKSLSAIGETGLDKLSQVDFELQKEVFVEHIKLAQKLNLPLVIHCVRSFNEVFKCLQGLNFQQDIIFHDFNGNESTYLQLLRFNSYFSFGDKVYKQNSRGFKSLMTLPVDRMFLETDDGRHGSIESIYRDVAKLKNLSISDLKAQLLLNFNKVFC